MDDTEIIFHKVSNNRQKSEITREVLEDLPEWFGIESAVEEYVRKVQNFSFIKVGFGKETIGFISIKANNSFTSEIYVLGIKKAYHHRKIGEKLLKYTFAKLEKEGFSYVLVKTLDETIESAEYDKTRLFYEKMGFVPIDVITQIWGEDTPCLLLIKKL